MLLPDAERRYEPHFQMLRRAEGSKALLHEVAELPVYQRALIAVVTIPAMRLELRGLALTDRTVEEKVNNPFVIVTKHSCLFLPLA
jgi:DUF1365 family protein